MGSTTKNLRSSPSSCASWRRSPPRKAWHSTVPRDGIELETYRKHRVMFKAYDGQLYHRYRRSAKLGEYADWVTNQSESGHGHVERYMVSRAFEGVQQESGNAAAALTWLSGLGQEEEYYTSIIEKQVEAGTLDRSELASFQSDEDPALTAAIGGILKAAEAPQLEPR